MRAAQLAADAAATSTSVSPPVAGDAAPTPQPGDSYVHAFAKGLAVIRSFDSGAPSQTLSEVAVRAGVTRSGARRVLLTLQHLGYVAVDGRDFSLTPRVLELGFAYLSSQSFVDLAGPVLEALVAEVQESGSIAVLDGADVVFVRRTSARKIVGVNLVVGSRLPAYCTAHGRVLLAGLPPAQLRAVLQTTSPLPAHTGRTVTDIDSVIALVEQAARNGWSLSNQETEEGLISLAAPLVDGRGRVVASMNISGQVARTPPKHMRDQFLPKLLVAAGSISRTLKLRS